MLMARDPGPRDSFHEKTTESSRTRTDERGAARRRSKNAKARAARSSPIGLDPVEMILGSQPSANPAGVIPCEIIRRYERIPLDLSHVDLAPTPRASSAFHFRSGRKVRDRFRKNAMLRYDAALAQTSAQCTKSSAERGRIIRFVLSFFK